MELQLFARVLTVICSLGGLALIGTGAGGIKGEFCPVNGNGVPKLFPRGRVAPTTPLIAPLEGCGKKELVTRTLAEGYISIDAFFMDPAPGPGDGLRGIRRWRLSRRRFKFEAEPFRKAVTGPDNIIFANSIGIRAAFLLNLISTLVAILLVFIGREMFFLEHVNAGSLDRWLLVYSLVTHAGAGALGIVWGTFSHLSPEQKDVAKNLSCMGWVAGGVALLIAAFIQFVDLAFTVCFVSADDALSTRSRSVASQRTPASVMTRLGGHWTARRAPGPRTGYTTSARPGTTHAPTTGNSDVDESTWGGKGAGLPGPPPTATGATRPGFNRHAAANRTATNVQSKANQASMPTNE